MKWIVSSVYIEVGGNYTVTPPKVDFTVWVSIRNYCTALNRRKKKHNRDTMNVKCERSCHNYALNPTPELHHFNTEYRSKCSNDFN